MTAPGIDGILEAALYATDLDAAEAFYGGVLGLPRLQRVGNRHVFYRAGSTTLLIFNPDATANPSSNPNLPVPPHGTEGPGHLCFGVTSEGLKKWRRHLAVAAIPIEADFSWPNGATSIYCRDPAGNSVEFAEKHLWD